MTVKDRTLKTFKEAALVGLVFGVKTNGGVVWPGLACCRDKNGFPRPLLASRHKWKALRALHDNTAIVHQFEASFVKFRYVKPDVAKERMLTSLQHIWPTKR